MLWMRRLSRAYGMRNLMEYPITKEEIIGYLTELFEDVDPEKTRLVGDMRPSLLREAIEIIKNAQIGAGMDREDR
jgi:hypothetical protein